jgi:hypothetical protein
MAMGHSSYLACRPSSVIRQQTTQRVHGGLLCHLKRGEARGQQRHLDHHLDRYPISGVSIH